MLCLQELICCSESGSSNIYIFFLKVTKFIAYTYYVSFLLIVTPFYSCVLIDKKR